ncbi:dephospho-CoA kinase [Macrococcoides caseolyticum]|uniref:Dephospho-CoA kinase n=1 Tax=Macrococcoides caseolyticum TaxID=69966 RepID=A0A855GI59_9STAP|nr:dephospho-CoA kinase [Macrococcus caseolyticus]ARQ04935.1 Dephospho-CoA kinase [Macrococcus caseolyticus]PKE18006.1 dephospho-CoA kinase [Macrococcus caseolyticus]PKE19175.1 dephospho-CoA kinase [Macrococcus caseolyticus]PKE22559.1 dephospho-CoA kinase [Macrococcus caseolyticus]PKE25534.1 dephospho-CoA kinase [Macrococcus caseolyticus]
MTVIGLTGGIASGKSTVANYLKENGFAVIDADIAARQAVEKGTEGLRKVAETFPGVLNEDGTLNRKALGTIIFNDKAQRDSLNEIVHPIVRRLMDEEKAAALSEGKVVVMDIPLLYENELEHTVDEVWVVYVSYDIQKMRLMKRNELSESEADARINSQMSMDEKRDKADIVIDNCHDLNSLYKHLEALIKDYK